VKTEREALHFSKVTPALLRRHGLADFDKMTQHLRLALGSQRTQFNKLLFHLRRDISGASQQLIQFALLGLDLRTHLAAFWQVTLVKLPDTHQLGIAEAKLLPQPIKVVGWIRHLPDANPLRD
jgi:hypothetical protein